MLSQNEPAAPPHKRKERERTFAFLMQKMCEEGRRGVIDPAYPDWSSHGEKERGAWKDDKAT